MNNYPANNNWQYTRNYEVTTETEYENQMLVEMYAEMARLQERVKYLEQRQTNPSNAFWGQVIFDICIGFCLAGLAVWVL